MNEATIKEFEKLSAYWNEALAFEGRPLANGYVEDDWWRICPSSKLIEAIKRLKGSNKVLDYGAGSGWASIAAVKCGVNNILAVDTAENSAKMVGYYAKAFGVDKEITPQLIDSEWLIKEDDESYDGIICSNVLDVIPLEMMEESLANLAPNPEEGLPYGCGAKLLPKRRRCVKARLRSQRERGLRRKCPPAPIDR